MKNFSVFIISLFIGFIACNNVGTTDLPEITQIETEGNENVFSLPEPTETEYGNVLSTTESFVATLTGVYRVYKWGKSCRSQNFYSQTDTPYKIGFTSTGSSSCFTETTYVVRAKFSHPNFKNSQVTNIVIMFDVQISSGTTTPYPKVQVVSLNKNCAYSEDNQGIFDCVNCYSPYICHLIANNIQSTDEWETKTITINNSTNPSLKIFEAEGNDIILGFLSSTKLMDIKNIRCDITY